MAKETVTNIRRKERYSHIYITLKASTGNEWQMIKAVDWNEDGFNFFIEHEFEGNEIFFKKGVNKFSGNIMWTRRSDHYSDLLEMILNTMLFEELDKLQDKKDIYERIINLIRSRDRIMEKKKLLQTLNRKIIDNETEILAKKHHEQNPLYRYGVKVDSKDWGGVIEYALEASSIVRVMDEINKNLSGLSGVRK